MSSFATRAFVPSLIVGFAAACSSPSNVTVKKVAVNAAAGALITVSAQDSQELAGTQISIPAGALSADTTITVAVQSSAIVPTTGEAAGPVANLGPAGTTFSSPVTLTLPYTLSGSQDADDLYMYVLEDNSSSQLIYQPDLQLDTGAGTGSVQISGFTRFQHGAHSCSSDERFCRGACVNLTNDPNHCGSCQAACDPGQVCVNRSCESADGGGQQDAGDIQDAGEQDAGAIQDAGTEQDAGTIQDAGATQLVFITAPQTVDAGECSLATTVQFQDNDGNPVVSGQLREISMSPSTSVSIYADTGCTQVTQFVLPVEPGDLGVTYSFKGQSGPLTWTVASNGVDSGTQTETIH